jgi:hypothetical protein
MIKNIYTAVFFVFIFALLASKYIWFLPFILIFPVIVTFVLPSPLALLGGLAILSEFFSTSLPGIMVVVVLLPWLTAYAFKRFYKEVKVDFLISFYLIVGLIIFCQIILLSLSLAVPESLGVWEIIIAVPWLKAMFTIIASSLIVATASIFIRYNTAWL